MSDTDALLFANEMFYRAFADRDITVMSEIWAEDAPCTCLHPGWHPLEGREEILQSWHNIFNGPEPPRIDCVAPDARIIGESGIVICYEKIGMDYLVATNLFVRRGHVWMLIHHQSGPVTSPPEKESEERRKPDAIN